MKNSVNNNPFRIGSFTSSGIADLMSNGKAKGTYGKPFYSYITQKVREGKLLRSINNDADAKATSWGKLNELRVFNLLGKGFISSHDEYLFHPTISNWGGSPDGIRMNEMEYKVVGDVKCPFTLSSFCDFVDCIELSKENGLSAIWNIRNEHKDGEKYYWQLVSNAIITGADYAELIIYCPYQSELQSIRDEAMAMNDKKYDFVFYSDNNEIPYLPDGGFYKNLNIFTFEVPYEDKEALTDRVKTATELLKKRI